MWHCGFRNKGGTRYSAPSTQLGRVRGRIPFGSRGPEQNAEILRPFVSAYRGRKLLSG
jgi:hypothetical protein